MAFTEEKPDEWRDGRRKRSLWLVVVGREEPFYELRGHDNNGETLEILARRIVQLRAEVACKG